MKTSRMWAAAGCLLAGLGASVEAQDTTFTLVNNTEFTVRSVYIWPVTTDYRGPDRLGSDYIPSGRSYAFRPEDDTCRYNIHVTMTDSEDEFRTDSVNLCELRKLTLYYDYQERDLWASID
ncbi:MAG: hypothetical protein ACRYF7_02320 [Janthinobacterium lividum]